MPPYLVQLSYTAEAWATQLANPQDRRATVQPLFDQLGGRIEVAYYAFGPYDVVLIADLPDNASAAALALTLRASGTVTALQTTPLLPVEEGVAAMRRAAEAGRAYEPPLSPAELEARLQAFEEGP
jgi:uncharacterized protein with GYD domain